MEDLKIIIIAITSIFTLSVATVRVVKMYIDANKEDTRIEWIEKRLTAIEKTLGI